MQVDHSESNFKTSNCPICAVSAFLKQNLKAVYVVRGEGGQEVLSFLRPVPFTPSYHPLYKWFPPPCVVSIEKYYEIFRIFSRFPLTWESLFPPSLLQPPIEFPPLYSQFPAPFPLQSPMSNRTYMSKLLMFG